MENALRWVQEQLKGGVVAMDIETAGLDPFRHPALAGGIYEQLPGGRTVAHEWKLGTKRGYLVPKKAPTSAAERIALEKRLLRSSNLIGSKTISKEQMLAQMDDWAKENIWEYARGIKGDTITPGQFYSEFSNKVLGKIGVIQNVRFESKNLSYLSAAADYTQLAKSAPFASKDYRLLRMVPKSTEDLISKAFRTGTVEDWWATYGAEGGLRTALAERGDKTLLLDLMDVTRAMFAGAQKAGVMKGARGDVFTGTNINILNLAWSGKPEPHQPLMDAKLELRFLQRNLTIAEKLHRSAGRRVDMGKLFSAKESRFLQRIDNVREWLKVKNLEKTFANIRLQAERGEGVELAFGTLPPIKRSVYEEGVETTAELMDLPRRMSSYDIAQRVMPDASRSAQLAYEKRIIFDRWASRMPDEMLPKAKQVWAKIQQMSSDEALSVSKMELSASEILKRMEGTGARASSVGWQSFTDDLAGVIARPKQLFQTAMEKHPSAMKWGAVAAVGVLALGALATFDFDPNSESRPTTYPYTPLEGIRRKNSVYNTLQGVYTSGMEFANVSDFSSGRDWIKSAVRSAASMYTHARGQMKRFAIRFPRPPKTRPTGIVKPTEMAPVQPPAPVPMPVNRGMGPLDLNAFPPRSSGPRSYVTGSKQALDPLPTSRHKDQSIQRILKQARTRSKLRRAEADGVAAHSPHRKDGGLGEVIRKGNTDFGSPSDPRRIVSRRTTEDQLRPRKVPTDAKPWVIDRDKAYKEAVLSVHHSRVWDAAESRADVGVAAQNHTKTPGRIFNELQEKGVTAGQSYAGLEYSTKKRKDPGAYKELLSAVDSGLEVVPHHTRARDQVICTYGRGHGGIIDSRPGNYKIGSQHKRAFGTNAPRRLHPVRSRALRSCG